MPCKYFVITCSIIAFREQWQEINLCIFSTEAFFLPSISDLGWLNWRMQNHGYRGLTILWFVCQHHHRCHYRHHPSSQGSGPVFTYLISQPLWLLGNLYYPHCTDEERETSSHFQRSHPYKWRYHVSSLVCLAVTIILQSTLTGWMDPGAMCLGQIPIQLVIHEPCDSWHML